MKFSKLISALVLPVLLCAAPSFAADRGTAAEAAAMLANAMVAVAMDEAKALVTFTKGEGGFKDRDLYVFCGGADGNFSAHPSLVGKSMKGLMDKGTPPKAVGEEFYKTAAAGGGEVNYMWPLPGTTDPIKKVALVAPAGKQVCAVGYYP
ncbi:Chemotaxis protein [uncultured Gammaproteobacteria bacterium]